MDRPSRTRKPTAKLREALAWKQAGLKKCTVNISKEERELADQALRLLNGKTPRGRPTETASRPRRNRKRVNYDENRASSLDREAMVDQAKQRRKTRSSPPPEMMKPITTQAKPESLPEIATDVPKDQAEFLASLDLQPAIVQLRQARVLGVLTTNALEDRQRACDFLNEHPEAHVLIDEKLYPEVEVILVEKLVALEHIPINRKLFLAQKGFPSGRELVKDQDHSDTSAARGDLEEQEARELSHLTRKIDFESTLLRAAKATYASKVGERQHLGMQLHQLRSLTAQLRDDVETGEKQVLDFQRQRSALMDKIDSEMTETEHTLDQFYSHLEEKKELLNNILQETHNTSTRIHQEEEKLLTALQMENRHRQATVQALTSMERMRGRRAQVEDLCEKQNDQFKHHQARSQRLEQDIVDSEDLIKTQQQLLESAGKTRREYDQALDSLRELLENKDRAFNIYAATLERLTHQTNLTTVSLMNEGSNLATATQCGAGLRLIANLLASVNQERNVLVRQLKATSHSAPHATGLDLRFSPFPFCKTHHDLTEKPCPNEDCRPPNRHDVLMNALTSGSGKERDRFGHQPIACAPMRRELSEVITKLPSPHDHGVKRPTWPPGLPRSTGADQGGPDLIPGPPPREGYWTEADRPPGTTPTSTPIDVERSTSVSRSVTHSRSVSRSSSMEQKARSTSLLSPRSPSPKPDLEIADATSEDPPAGRTAADIPAAQPLKANLPNRQSARHLPVNLS